MRVRERESESYTKLDRASRDGLDFWKWLEDQCQNLII